jgi:hypothetical protein
MDIDKLKAEINSRKTERTTKDVALGKVPEGAIPKLGKRQFLSELVTSMHRGVATNAVEAIKAVNETVEMKKGAPNAVAKTVGKYVPPRNVRQMINEEEVVAPVNYKKSAADEWGLPSGIRGGMGGDGERDHLFEQENAKFDQMMMSGNPIAAKYVQQIQQPQQPRYITEQAIPTVVNESHIDQLLTEKLERNMEKMVESAFKSVLTSIYTKQKIQESLADFLESEDFVKVVAKAINEIAKRKKGNQVK